MSTELRRSALACLLMVLAAVSTHLLIPTQKLVDIVGHIDLESAVPKAFGDWQMAPVSGGVVNPQQTEMLNKLYSETLSRTYINSKTGAAVMLSIAYGEDQRDNMQAHLPEICYPAQGFQLQGSRHGALQLAQGSIPVKRIETVAGGRRYEPVTYWIMVGEQSVIGGGVGKKIAEMGYSLRGLIPDGLLFRVSSIDRDSAAAFTNQDAFVAELIPHLAPEARRRLAGLQ